MNEGIFLSFHGGREKRERTGEDSYLCHSHRCRGVVAGGEDLCNFGDVQMECEGQLMTKSLNLVYL